MGYRLLSYGLLLITLSGLSCTDTVERVTVVGGPGQTGGDGGHAPDPMPTPVCEPGTVQTCSYSGPEGTLDVGACRAGTATCALDGLAYEPCAGEVVPKVEDCSTSEDDDCNGSTACEILEWAKSFGGPKGQGIRAMRVAPDGSILMGGWYYGSVSFGGDTFTSANFYNDCYVAKLSPSGEHIWSRPLWSKGNEIVEDVAFDSAGGSYVAGYFATELNIGDYVLSSKPIFHVFLAQFDPDGKLLGAKAFGDSGNFDSPSIAVTPNDDLVLLVTGRGTVDFGNGPLESDGLQDVFLVKFDKSGQLLWSKQFGDSKDQFGWHLVLDSTGNIFITGHFRGTIDFGGGSLENPNELGSKVFMAKFDSAGNHLMSKMFGNAGDMHMQEIALDPAGNIILVGNYSKSFDLGGGPLLTYGGTDIFLAKLDPLGNHIFSKGFGDAADQYSWGTAVDKQGRIAMTFTHRIGGNGISLDGTHTLQELDLQDGFVALFDNSGAYQWTLPISGPQYPWVGPIAFDANGDLIAGGSFQETIGLGNASLTSVDSEDIFLVKLRP